MNRRHVTVRILLIFTVLIGSLSPLTGAVWAMAASVPPRPEQEAPLAEQQQIETATLALGNSQALDGNGDFAKPGKRICDCSAHTLGGRIYYEVVSPYCLDILVRSFSRGLHPNCRSLYFLS